MSPSLLTKRASLAWVACLLAACAPLPAPSPAPSRAEGPADMGPIAATARLRTPSGQPGGTVTFTPGPGGLALAFDVQGLKPGSHGVHIHAHGACTPGPDGATGRIVDFGGAGPHLDPGQSRNHARPGQPIAHAHAGDLPALEAGAAGRAVVQVVQPHLTLDRASSSVLGRTVVVHADPDDYMTDPAGNSGARLLCGVIEANGPTLVRARTLFEGAQVYPEGIAFDPRTGDVFVGSTQNGDLFRIRPGAPQAELLQAGGAVGRQGAFGLKVDELGRLWVAGGPNGTLSVVQIGDASTTAVLKAPTDMPSFLNDLVITRGNTVYVTDSFRPVLYRVRSDGAALALEPWLDLSQTPIRYRPNQINLNGLVASADGRYLLSIQLVTGELWRIDTQTKAVTQVQIDGDLTDGDGLVLTQAQELYVIRNARNELARVRLSADWSSGRVEQRLTDSRLRYPSTAAVTPAGLMVVNAQLDRQKQPPPLLPFDFVTVELPKP